MYLILKMHVFCGQDVDWTGRVNGDAPARMKIGKVGLMAMLLPLISGGGTGKVREMSRGEGPDRITFTEAPDVCQTLGPLWP